VPYTAGPAPGDHVWTFSEPVCVSVQLLEQVRCCRDLPVERHPHDAQVVGVIDVEADPY